MLVLFVTSFQFTLPAFVDRAGAARDDKDVSHSSYEYREVSNMKIDTLETLLQSELMDIYDAEQRLVRALPNPWKSLSRRRSSVYQI